MLMCLHEADPDRFYDLVRAINSIFAEDPYEAVTILFKDAFVILLNDFSDKLLNENADCTYVYNTNGSVGKKFRLIR